MPFGRNCRRGKKNEKLFCSAKIMFNFAALKF